MNHKNSLKVQCFEYYYFLNENFNLIPSNDILYPISQAFNGLPNALALLTAPQNTVIINLSLLLLLKYNQPIDIFYLIYIIIFLLNNCRNKYK